MPSEHLLLAEATRLYQAACADARVHVRAPIELRLAKHALDDALREHAMQGNPSTVDQLAHLAKERATHALEIAQGDTRQ